MEPKKTRRKLSRFLCQEMLYDYVSDTLDPDRREAIREFLASDEQCREELECLREGLSFCEKLSHTTVALPLLEKMKRTESVPSKALSRLSWSKLPAPLRLGIEALGVSVVVAVIVSSIPWNRFSFISQPRTGQIEIAQVDRPADKAGSAPAAAAPSEDESITTVAEDSTPAAAVAPPTPSPTPSPVVAAAPAVKPAPAPVAKVESSAVPLPDKKSSIPPSAALGPSAIEEDPAKQGPMHAKGFIFKAFMRLGDLDNITPKVADALRKNGAERAGEVELGWRRSTGSYYHFTLPESNYDEVLKALQAFGPVRIFREPHYRVMPEGKIRFILWIEDGK